VVFNVVDVSYLQTEEYKEIAAKGAFRWKDVQAEFERARAADRGDAGALRAQVQGVVTHIFTGRDSSHGWVHVAEELHEQFGSARTQDSARTSNGSFTEVVAAATAHARKSSSFRRAWLAPMEGRPLSAAEEQA
jgi:hypothetical protein